jgi:AraC-like DNA-binding protein
VRGERRSLWDTPLVETHSVPSGVVVDVVRLARRWDVSPEELLEGLDLPSETLDDALARVPLQSYLTVVERARNLTGEPGLGFCLGLQARVSAFGHLGFAALSASTVREAIELAVQFAPMISTAMNLRLRVESGVASLIVEERAELGSVRDVIVLARLAALWTIAMSLTGEDLKGTAETVIAEPPYHARFEHLVPPLTYGRPTNRIVMRAEALDVPLIMADPVALRLAREHCEKALDSISSGGRLVRTVRQLLSKPDGGFLDLEGVADAVHMSQSTLKRRLMLQGYSLSALLQEERRDRALLLLRSSALSIDDVADRLGYSSVQNFARAFRRWTGTTPAAYRQSCIMNGAAPSLPVMRSDVLSGS